MADKLNGRAIANNSIPIDRITGTLELNKFDSTFNDYINDGGRPTIKSITYFGSNTTASVEGGQSIILTGSNFNANVQIYVNGNAAPSVSRTNANSVSFTTAAQSAGTYLVYAINPDGGFGILAPGIEYA